MSIPEPALNLSRFAMSAWCEPTSATVVAMCGQADAPSAPSPAKRTRRSTHREEVEPTTEQKKRFWEAVKMEDVGHVWDFCSSRPELMQLWKDNEDCLRQGPLQSYAALVDEGLVDDSLRSGSLAVLFLVGFEIPIHALSTFAFHVFGRLAAKDTLRPHMSALISKMLAASKTDPVVLENILVGIAKAQNYEAFHQFFPRGTAKKQLFHIPIHQHVYDTSVLRAVAQWQDRRLRNSVFSDVLSKCSMAYIMTQHEARGKGDEICARNIFDELALIPEPELLALVIDRVRADGVLDRAKDLFLGALKQSLRAVTFTGLSDAVSSVHMQLMQYLSEDDLAQLRTHLYALEQSAIQIKTRLRHETGHVLYVNAVSALAILSRVQASFASVLRSASAKQRVLFLSEEAVEAEETVFQQRYSANLKMIDANITLQADMDKLRDENRVLEEQVRKQATMLRDIQDQAAVIATLRAKLLNASSDVDSAELQSQIQATEKQLLESLETRLLALRMPEVPVGIRHVGSNLDLDLRLFALKCPDVPTHGTTPSPVAGGSRSDSFNDDQAQEIGLPLLSS